MARQEKIICVGCPSGCLVTLTVDDRGEVTKVSGDKCKEGREYVINEYKNPVRVLTATVLTEASSQPLLPVRTDKPILRTRLREGMRVLAKVKAKPPLKVGDILIPNFLDIGVNLVASTNLPS
jgi:CxxC motif-containing protein